MDKLCKGCELKFENHMYICSLDSNKYFSKVINDCPCQACLVKGICKNHCMSFIDYISKVLLNIPKCKECVDFYQRIKLVADSPTSRLDILLFLQFYHFDNNVAMKRKRLTKLIQLNKNRKVHVIYEY